MARAPRARTNRQTVTRPAALSALAALTLLSPAAAHGQTCAVPGTHASVQAAVSDPACATVELAAQTFSESPTVDRSLALAGAPGGGSVVAGRLAASGAGVVLALSDLAVSGGCDGAGLDAAGGASIVSRGVSIVRATNLPCAGSWTGFSNGFEGGTTDGWTEAVP
jgi:hypothetical protein